MLAREKTSAVCVIRMRLLIKKIRLQRRLLFIRLSFIKYMLFISNTYISYARLKLAKNQTKSKQHPEAEILLFENYSLSPRQRYHPKISRLFKRHYMINDNGKTEG